MLPLKVVDLNRALIQVVKRIGVGAKWGDYFADIQPNEVLMTASNPMWTFGGGIDALFMQNYPNTCRMKQVHGGGMERVNNIVCAITVNEDYRATPEIITEAIKFALSTLKENETLRISGVGTGIGGLSIADFCAVLESLKPKTK